MNCVEVHKCGKTFRFDQVGADTWEIWVESVEDLFGHNCRKVWRHAGNCDTAGMLGVELIEILAL